jgi:hypothetical protein
MFHLNLGSRRVYSEVATHGIVHLPSENNVDRLTPGKSGDYQSVLLDPQLYLKGAAPADCQILCLRLAGYGWFGVAPLDDFDLRTPSGYSKEEKERARAQVARSWSAAVPSDPAGRQAAARAAIEMQLSVGATQLILPAPLITEREDEAGVQGDWIDDGVAATNDLEVDLPRLATVALHEEVLSDAAFQPLGFLDTVIDQVTSRDGVDGVYIVVAQKRSGHPFTTPERVLRAYLYLVKRFARRGYQAILTNYADVFGLICMGAGATGFATGASFRQRRLCIESLIDEGGGKVFPHYYSHRLIGELRTEEDLAAIIEHRLLQRVRDESPVAQPLLEVLDRGGSAGDLQAWAEGQNNLTAAVQHFIWRMNAEAQRLLAEPLPARRRDMVRAWLEDADANALYIKNRLKKAAPKGERVAPAGTWLRLYDEIVMTP